jgi:TRAP transporter TAXI family solute receptor
MLDLKRTYKKSENIRILLPMGTEQIHIVTLKPEGKKGITSFADLKKKRVGIGSALMGTNITAKYIKEVTGSKWEDVEIPFDKSFKALFNGSIDAFFYVGAKPVKDLENISKAMRDKITLISIPADKDGKLELAYSKVTITPDDYKWLAGPVETFAVKSLLVTSLAGQTPEKEEAIKQMLELLKTNLPMMQSKIDASANGKSSYHKNWKDIKFEEDTDIDWDYYPAALKVY